MMLDAAATGDLKALLGATGEKSAQLLILTLMLTPLRLLWPKAAVLIWLRRRRRYLGVAAFAYALLHTAAYLADKGALAAIIADFGKIGVWAGWLSFLVLVPLAMTSNDWSVRRFGRSWRDMQRLSYLAAAALLIHWLFGPKELVAASLHFAPLIALQLYRLRRRASAPAARDKAGAASAMPPTLQANPRMQ